MYKRSHSHSLKRPMALVAFGFLASLSLSAQAGPVDYGYRENRVSNFPIYQDHSYRGHHNLVHRGHRYYRFDYDRYAAPHRGRIRSHGSYADYSQLFHSGEHSYRNNYTRRRRHH